MAQRTIHILLGKYIIEEAGIKRPDRFLLGCLLPDAHVDPDAKRKTHYFSLSADGLRKCFDFKRFQRDFAGLVPGDELYLGYYLHLVADVLYRRFLFDGLDLRTLMRGRDYAAILHNDYRLLNAYIAEKYGIPRSISEPEGFEREKINALARFDVRGVLEAYRRDLSECPEGKARFVTGSMLDKFIAGCAPLCLTEALKLQNHEGFLSPTDLMWDK